MLALGRWGFEQMGEPGPDDIVTADSLTMALRTAFRPDAAAALPAGRLRGARRRRRPARAGRRRRPCASRSSRRPSLRPSGARFPAGEPELVFAAGPGIRRIISGELTPAEAIDQDVLAVVSGDATLLERFAATFHIDLADAAALAA